MKKSSTQHDPLIFQSSQLQTHQEQMEEFERQKKEMKDEFSFQIRCICEHYDEQFQIYTVDMERSNDEYKSQFMNIFHEKYEDSQVKLYQSLLKDEYGKKIQFYNKQLQSFKDKFFDFQKMVEPLLEGYKKIQTNQSDEVIKLIFEYQDKVKDYLSDNKEKSDIIKYLSSQNQQLEGTLKSMLSSKTVELSQQKKVQDYIQQENIHLKKSIQNLEVEKINLIAMNQDYLKKSFHFQTELEKKKNLQKNASDLGNISACLKLELNEREDKITILKKQNEDMKLTFDKIQEGLEQKIDSHIKEIELLKSQLKIEIATRENIVYDKNQDIDRLEKRYQRDIAAQEDRKQDIHKNLMKNEMEHIQLKNKYQDLKEDFESMQFKLESNVKELEGEIELQKLKFENDLKLMQEQTFKQVMEAKYVHEKSIGKIHEDYAQKIFHLKTQLGSLEKLLKHEEELVKQKSNELILMEQNHKQYVEDLTNQISDLNYKLYQQNVVITESSLSNSRSIKQIEYITIENSEHINKIEIQKQEINKLNETISKQDEIILQNIQKQQELIAKKEAEYKQKLDQIIQQEKQKYYEQIKDFVKQHQKVTDSTSTQTELNLDNYIQDLERNLQMQVKKMDSQYKEEFSIKELQIKNQMGILSEQLIELQRETEKVKEDCQVQIEVYKKQITDINNRHKAEINLIKNDIKKEKNEKFLNKINKLEQEKQEYQQELEKLKELNQIHYERLIKKLKEDFEKKIFELEQIIKNERHKSHLLKSEHVLAQQNLISQHQSEMQTIKVALKEAQDKVKKAVSDQRHAQIQTSPITISTTNTTLRSTQTDNNYIQEIVHKDKQLEMEIKMQKFEKQCNDERDKLINEQDSYLKKMLQEFKSLQELFDDKYNNLNEQYQKLQLEYEARPSRYEDIDLIDKLNRKIDNLQKQYKELTMDVQNRETNYNKVFKSNPIVGVYAPLNNLKVGESLPSNQQIKHNKQQGQFSSLDYQSSVEFDNQISSTFQNKIIKSSITNINEAEKSYDNEKSIEYDKSRELSKDNQFERSNNLQLNSINYDRYDSIEQQIENKPNLINLPPKQPKKEMYSLNQPIINLILSKNQPPSKRYKKNSLDLNKSQESLEDTLKIQQQGINRNKSPLMINSEEKLMIKNTSLPSGQLLGEFLDSDLPMSFSNETHKTPNTITNGISKKQNSMRIIQEDTQETEKTPYRRKNKLVVKGINMKKIDNSQVQYVIESNRSMMINNNNNESSKNTNTPYIPPLMSSTSQQSNQSNVFGLPPGITNTFAQTLNRKIRSQNSNYQSIDSNNNQASILNNKINFSSQSPSVNMNRCSTAMTGQYRSIGNNTNQSSSVDRSTLDLEVSYSKNMKRKYFNSSLDLPSSTSNERYFDKLFSVSKSSNGIQQLNLNSSTNASLISGQQNMQIENGIRHLDSIQVNDILTSSSNAAVVAPISSTFKNSFKQKQIPLNKLYKTINN